MEGKTLHRHNNHDHYWVNDGWLYETYNTIRGKRFMQIMDVNGIPDTEKCTDECITHIEKEFLN